MRAVVSGQPYSVCGISLPLSLSVYLSVPRTGNYLPNSSNLRANESPKYIRNGVIIPSRQLSTSPGFNNTVHIRTHTCLPSTSTCTCESSCTSSSLSSASAATSYHEAGACLGVCFALLHILSWILSALLMSLTPLPYPRYLCPCH